jgi:hypothetical protein
MFGFGMGKMAVVSLSVDVVVATGQRQTPRQWKATAVL